jgi:hypothetical protein
MIHAGSIALYLYQQNSKAKLGRQNERTKEGSRLVDY